MLDSAGIRMAQVLVVCTGNICRSPMAEGFLKDLFELRQNQDQDQGEPIEVSSAGTSAWDGSPATAEAISAAADREADITEHRARRLAAHHVEQADLVLGMTTEHAAAATRLVPPAMPRTFTLKELVQLVEALPPGDEPEGSNARRLRATVARADQLRIDGFQGNRFDLDVVDPIGLSIDTYRAVAWELDQLCTRLVDGMLGKATAPSTLTTMWKENE
jgi:protein-tyrosine phosphatase